MLRSSLAGLALLAVAQAAPSAPTGSTRSTRRWLPNADKIRGVNLGSTFIIEPWMAQDEWSSMGCGDANDEWKCVEAMGQEAADAAFATHWDTWVTQDDISQITSLGLNTIRIPVGFWIKEDLVYDSEFYPRGGLEYLDRLVGQASDAGLYIIMDLHGGPGSQTANQQFTGHGVDYPGWFTAENYERTHNWLEWMADRIHTNEAYRNVGTLQVMNEPAQSFEHPDLAADMVQNFYPAALERIQAAESNLGVSDGDRLHVQFMAEAWGSGDPTQYLPSLDFTSFDDHRYFKWDTSVEATKESYIAAACSDNRGGDEISIGEWSLSVATEAENNEEFSIRDRPEQAEWYLSFWAAQAQAFERSGGWIFWTWKCNYIGGSDEWRWCYQSAVAAGAIPQDAGSAGSISPC